MIVSIRKISIALTLLGTVGSGWAQEPLREDIIAVYLFRFAENIEWFNESQFPTFNIHVIDDSTELANTLGLLVFGQTIRNKPIQVSNSASSVLPDNVHLLYLSADKNNLLPRIDELITDQNVLLVSDSYNNDRLVMINLLDTDSGQVRFEINKANILNQGLAISPDIVLLGGTEIDVAALYRSSQDDLRLQEREVQSLQQNIILLNNTLDDAREEANSLERTIEEQRNTLEEAQNQLNQVILQTETQEIELTEQRAELDNLARQLLEQDVEIASRNSTLAQQNLDIDSFSSTIEQQRELIAQQELLVRDQLSELDENSTLIQVQRASLNLLGIVAIFTAILVAIVSFAYRQKKRSELELQEKSLELAKSADFLRSANARLQEVENLKSMFISSMSHELRTPLNAIIGFSSLMLKGMSGELNETQEEDIGRVNRAAKHLLSLITSIIDISKLEAGFMRTEVSEFDLALFMQEATEVILPQLKAKNMALNISPVESRNIRTDRKLLLQCLYNLLSNAVKYSEKGSVTIWVEDFGDVLRFYVKDTGIGIPAEEMKNLYLAFERLENDLPVSPTGTGLGLYLTEKILRELLHGSIHCESEVHKGTTFSIEVPCNLPLEDEALKSFPSIVKESA